MSKITIPPEALEEATKASYNKWRDKFRAEQRENIDADILNEIAPKWNALGANRLDWIEQTRAACLAMIENWPGMTAKHINEHVALFHSAPAIILPLTENSDERE